MSDFSSFMCSPCVKQALAIAHKIARRNNSNYVGIEHLVVAVLSYEEGAGYKLLVAAGVNVAEMRQKLITVYDRDLFAPQDALPQEGNLAEVAALLRKAADILSA